MVGRRRPSDSTVGSAADADDDLHHPRHQPPRPPRLIRFVPEHAVLRASAAHYRSDDFPTFRLLDAAVYRRPPDRDGHGRGGRLEFANLLDVDLHGPFVLRGKLEVDAEDPRQRNALVKRGQKPGHVEIPVCDKCCIGTNGHGQIWGSGKAGWFEIVPSAEYELVHTKMVRAVELYYHILEPLELASGRKKKNVPKFDEVLFKAAVAVGDGSTLEDMIDTINEHKVFFLAQFLKEETFRWNDTDFCKRLVAENADLFETLQKRMASDIAGAANTAPAAGQVPGPVPLADPPPVLQKRLHPKQKAASQASSAERQSSLDRPSPTGVALPVGRSRRSVEKQESLGPPGPSGAMDVDPPVPAKVEDHDPSATDSLTLLLAIIEQMYDEKVAAGRKVEAIAMKTIKSRLHRCYQMPAHPASEETLIYHAPQLVKVLDRRKYEQTPLWEWLERAANAPYKPPTAIRPEDMARKLIRRKPKEPRLFDGPGPAAVGSEGQYDTGFTSASGGSHARSPGAESSSRLRGRPAGKVSGLRLVSAAKKRYRSPQDDGAAGREHWKRTARGDLRDTDGDDTMEDSVETASPAAAATTTDDGDDYDDDDEVEEAVRVVVRTERIPSMAPTGPNGTWVCEQEGCGHVVRGASGPDGQARIREHFDEHERQTDQINLALTEGRGRHLPINHLLEKIKSLGEKQKDGDQMMINDAVVPQPVRRRLLI